MSTEYILVPSRHLRSFAYASGSHGSSHAECAALSWRVELFMHQATTYRHGFGKKRGERGGGEGKVGIYNRAHNSKSFQELSKILFQLVLSYYAIWFTRMRKGGINPLILNLQEKCFTGSPLPTLISTGVPAGIACDSPLRSSTYGPVCDS